MEKKTSEDEFYSDLDKKTLHQSCCTCKTMSILFGLLIIVGIGLAFYLYRAGKDLDFTSKTNNFTLEDKNKFLEKFEIDPSRDSREITITSAELTGICAQGISLNKILVKNIQFNIKESRIDIWGTLIKPINLPVKVEALPKIRDNKIELEAQKIIAGKLTLPKFLSNDIIKGVNAVLAESFKDLSRNFQIEEIILKDDKMLIKTKLKGD